MTTLATDNPFDLVYNALIALVQSSGPMTELLKDANLIRFNMPTQRDPTKQEISDSDTPELILSTEGTQKVNLHFNSCAATITRQYTWLLSTGDFRVQQWLNPVQFCIFAAMATYPQALAELTWKGAHFVKKSELLTLSEGISNSQLNRGIHGWSSLWRVSVDMLFAIEQLQEFHNTYPVP